MTLKKNIGDRIDPMWICADYQIIYGQYEEKLRYIVKKIRKRLFIWYNIQHNWL